MQLINWELIKQPENWLIVALMLLIGSFALCLLMGPGGGSSAPGSPLGTLGLGGLLGSSNTSSSVTY